MLRGPGVNFETSPTRGGDDVSQIVLALRIGGTKLAERPAQQVGINEVDARVDLVDRKLCGRGVRRLDDRSDGARRIAHDAAIASRRFRPHAYERERRAALPMTCD